MSLKKEILYQNITMLIGAAGKSIASSPGQPCDFGRLLGESLP